MQTKLCTYPHVNNEVQAGNEVLANLNPEHEFQPGLMIERWLQGADKNAVHMGCYIYFSFSSFYFPGIV